MLILILFVYLTLGFSGKRAGKFLPKPKLGKGKQKPSTSNPQTQVRSALPSEDVHFVPFDHGYAHGDSISEFLREDILDCSSARFSDPSAIAPTPEIHGDTEPTNLTEAAHLDDTVLGNMHSEDDPGVLGKVITFSTKIVDHIVAIWLIR